MEWRCLSGPARVLTRIRRYKRADSEGALALSSLGGQPRQHLRAIREPNVTEAVTGSPDWLGLGLVTSGSSGLLDIRADSAAFPADLAKGIDLGPNRRHCGELILEW